LKIYKAKSRSLIQVQFREGSLERTTNQQSSEFTTARNKYISLQWKNELVMKGEETEKH